jgi:glycyl-tRNA synthetase
MTTQKEDLPAFMKRRGFVYQGSEIYGGLAGVWEFGHIGKLMKNHLEKTWKDYFLSLDDNFYEIEGSIIMPKLVFEASGHLDNFDDPLAECFKCGTTERADKIIEEKLNRREESATNEELLKILNENNLNCSRCGNKFEKVSTFNMMFPITFGPKGGQTVYLRPETAQTPFLNFKIQHELLRKKLPMGLAVIGKAFRNEISPKNSLIRCREFEQAELQIFFNPKDINEEKISDTTNFSDIKDEKIIVMLQNKRDGSLKEMSPQELVKYGLPKFYVYYMAKVQNYILNILNIPKDKFRFYELNDKEKAFYNKNHFDL